MQLQVWEIRMVSVITSTKKVLESILGIPEVLWIVLQRLLKPEIMAFLEVRT